MRFADMEPIVEKLDAVGFHSLEVWGGATFDATHRFLQEDPWQRLRELKKRAPRTPLQMLLRGQNLVGYRNYPDDVVRAFCLHSVECGMDIFRVFDALNDSRNFETAFKALQETDAHIQATICFSATGRRMGGPVFSLDYFRQKAREFVAMGAHSLCLKDMAGILTPTDASLLVAELKKTVDVPLHIHSHCTAGIADLTYLRAIDAGVDVVDCAVAPFAYRSGQPAMEPLIVALEGTDRDTGLSLEPLYEIAEYLESITPKYRQFANFQKTSIIDVRVIRHQIPGGMLSNLINQLHEAGALDSLEEVYRELPKTRRDLGYPPLVTPTSQIVGVQAVMNILGGERYKLISNEVKDYCYGLYGRPPAPIDPEVRRKCLVGYARGETPIDCRPADILEPELEKAKADLRHITADLGDVLTYALYPRTGMAFLRYKHGLDKEPPGEKPRTEEQIKHEDEQIRRVLAGEKPGAKPAELGKTQTVRVLVEGEIFEVQVEVENLPPAAAPTVNPPVAAPPPLTAAAPVLPANAPQTVISGRPTVDAPMPGTIVRYLVAVGDLVKKGQPVVILEAMKMENSLPAPIDGRVVSLPKNLGAVVARGDVLAVIE